MYLDIGGNHLTRIPFAVSKAYNLRDLRVDHNQIDTVEDSDLSSLHNLTSLSLIGNTIAYLSPFAFTHNPLLYTIDISYTNIGHVPRALLGLNELHIVYFSGKPIECTCHDMHYLKSWNVTPVYIRATCSSGKSVKRYLALDLPKCL